MASEHSGVVAATCNGQSATVASGAVACTATLGPGRNDVILAARDAAGNVSSESVRIVRVGTSSVLGLTPTGRTLLVDETTTLSLTDEFGAVVTAAAWSSSDPAIVSVSTDDPPVLTALQAGTVTISAAKNGLSTEVSLTVMAGTTLPYGTTRWSISGAPGFTVGKSIIANRVDLNVPDMFSVESAGTTTIVRGITAAGDVLWTQHAPGYPLMGDSFGGLVAGIWSTSDPAYQEQYTAYVRFAGPAGSHGWRYDSLGTVSKPAQASDGTIYAVERYPIGVNNPNGVPILETQVLVLDGTTGAVRARHTLARERRGNPCYENWQAAPVAIGPIVGTDGFGYVLVRAFTNTPLGASCAQGWAQHVGVTLLRVSPTGSVSPTTVYSQFCTRFSGRTICDGAPELFELFPDGIGGSLVRTRYITSVDNDPFTTRPYTSETRLMRVHNGAVQFSNVVDFHERITMIGGTGTAFLSGYSTPVRTVDVTNWSTLWTGPTGTLAPVATLADGRFAMRDSVAGTLTKFAADGTPVESAPFEGGYQTAPGLFTKVELVGSTPTLMSRFSLALNEQINMFRRGPDSGTLQNSPTLHRGRTPYQEATAMMLMEHLLIAPPQYVNGERIEHGGQICRYPDGQQYYYLDLGRGSAPWRAPPLQIELCQSGTAVGYTHSHPRADATAALPSGSGSQQEYDDARPDEDGIQESDLKIADDFFENPIYGPESIRRSLTWYMTAPFTPQSFVKYKRTTIVKAKDNVQVYNRSTRFWDWIPAVW